MESIYLKKIKEFSKISITSICKKLKVNRSNLLNNRTSKENEQKVYFEIVEQYKSVIDKQEK